MTPEQQYQYWVKAYETAERALEVAQRNLERISRLLGNVSLHDAVERMGANEMLAGPVEPVTDWPSVPDVSGRDV